MFTLSEEPDDDDFGTKIEKIFHELAEALKNTRWFRPAGGGKERGVLPTENDPSAVYAGEQVTCENGHLICEIAETIHYGDVNWSRKLANWQMPVPESGSQPVCHECGELFWRFNNLHIKDRGWVSRHVRTE